MSQTAIVLSTSLLSLLILAFALWLALRILKARERRLDNLALQTATGDETPIPVRSLMTGGRGLGGTTKNSMNPRLSITRDGIRFRIFRDTCWSFAEIARVDLQKFPFGMNLLFTSTDGTTLTADVRNPDTAKRVLSSLPPTLPLTPTAAAARNNTEAPNKR